MPEVRETQLASPCGDDAEEVSLEDGRRLLDDAARRHLHMSGDEFVSAWDHGGFTEPDSPPVQRVAVLLPFAR